MSSANFEIGMKNRREVLGDAYVDNSWKHAERNEFVRPLMEMVTEQGWGAVWGRDGLDRKTRSLITLASPSLARADIYEYTDISMRSLYMGIVIPVLALMAVMTPVEPTAIWVPSGEKRMPNGCLPPCVAYLLMSLKLAS